MLQTVEKPNYQQNLRFAADKFNCGLGTSSFEGKSVVNACSIADKISASAERRGKSKIRACEVWRERTINDFPSTSIQLHSFACKLEAFIGQIKYRAL